MLNANPAITPRIPSAFPGAIKNPRIHAVDWLKIFAILVVFIVHSLHFFDPFDWHLKNAAQSMIPAYFMGFVFFWIMPLLFLLAGISSRWSLKSRNVSAYLKERVRRLLVPYAFAVAVLVPPVAFLEELTHGRYQGSLIGFFPVFYASVRIDLSLFSLVRISDMHLWFLWYLLLISLLVLPVLRLLERKWSEHVVERIVSWMQKPGRVLLWALVPAAVRIILQARFPRSGGWAEGLCYVAYYLFGGAILSQPRFLESVSPQRWFALAAGSAGLLLFIPLNAAGLVEKWFFTPDRSPGCMLYQLLYSLVEWSWVVFFLGFAVKRLDFSNGFLRRAGEAVLPFYILHQIVLLAVGYFVIALDLSILSKLAIVVAATMVIFLVAYEMLIRRFKALRFLFGMRTEPVNQKDSRHGCG